MRSAGAMNHIDTVYTKDFFAPNLADERAFTELANVLLETFPEAHSYFDVGCGAAQVLHAIHANGAEVGGIDGSTAALELAHYEVRSCLEKHDLTEPWEGEEEHVWDAVLCVEVAEHLPPSAADVLVETVLRFAHPGSAIIWSAAQPGQGGTDHQNEQPSSYWLERFAAAGWVPNIPETDRLRHGMRAKSTVHQSYAHNFWVLRALDEPTE